MYVRPSMRFGISEEIDKSGLVLVLINKKVMVNSVREASPAFDANIHAGDEVVSLNGKLATTMTLNSIREILQKE